MVHVHVNQNGVRKNPPRKVNAWEPFNNPHEVDFAALLEEMTEELFRLGIFGKIDKIINVKAKRERG